MPHEPQNPDRARPAALWASACVILALIIITAGRAPQAVAQSNMVSATSSYTLLSTDGGSEDVIVVLDSRGEEILVYKILNQSKIELYQKVPLPDTFIRGRAGVQGVR